MRSGSPRVTEMRCSACGLFHKDQCPRQRHAGKSTANRRSGSATTTAIRRPSPSVASNAYDRAAAAMIATSVENGGDDDAVPHANYTAAPRPSSPRASSKRTMSPTTAQQDGRKAEFLRKHMTVLVDAFEELRADHDSLLTNIDRIVEEKVAAALAGRLGSGGGAMVPAMSPSPSPIQPVRGSVGSSGGGSRPYGSATAYVQALGVTPAAPSIAQIAHEEAESQALYSRVRHLTSKLAEEKKQRNDDVRDLTLQLRQLRITVDSIRGTSAPPPTGNNVAGGNNGQSPPLSVSQVRDIVKEMEPQLIAKINSDLHSNAEHFRKLLTKHQDLVQSMMAEGQSATNRKVDTRTSSLDTEVAGLKAQLLEHQSATRRAFSSMSQTLHISAPVL